MLAAVLAQTAALTALLYYFGWAEGQAYFGHFGVSTSMLNLGTTDYVLRSVSVAVPPLLAAVCALTTLGILLPQLGRRASRWPVPVTRIGVLLLGLGASGLAVAALLSFTHGSTWHLPPAGRPLLLALAIAAAATAVWLGHETQTWTTRVSPVAMSLAFTVAALSVFWSWTLYARDAGVAHSQAVARNLDQRTAIAVYSAHRLAITGPGVTVIDISGAGTTYNYRYDGLRLLARADGQWFLLPRGWQAGRDAVFLIRDASDVRMDFVAAR